MKKDKFSLLKHPLVVVLIGTGLVTFSGVLLTNYYQTKTWEREKEYEIFKEKFIGGLNQVNHLAEAAGKRYFNLLRVYWVLNAHDLESVSSVWQNYYKSVVEWNAKSLQRRTKTEQYIGLNCADNFFSGADDGDLEVDGQTASVHKYFYRAHRTVQKFKQCVLEKCDDSEIDFLRRETKDSLNILGVSINEFVSKCSKDVFSEADRRSLKF